MKYRLLIFFVLFQFLAPAQKVALVLSGGGAKGTAHIGVIKALEEAGIPIDYIAGTSAGAIVGGMYAAGFTIEEMEAVFENPEFSNWVTGEINQDYLYYFKKPRPNPSWVRLKLNWDSILAPSLPINIVSPYQMDYAFIELFSPADVPSNRNFDSLFVPFRCVATNLNQNIGEVLKSGSLRDAIRASMTYPFYFKPIRINGNVMYDGGMRNNFPSDVALEEFHPDVIIGSKVSQPNEIPNPDNVFTILENMLMYNEEFDVLCGYGVLIEPHVDNVSVTDFSKAREFIANGYKAAMDKIPKIKQFVHDSVPKWEVELRRHAFKQLQKDLMIIDIEVSGLDNLQSEYVSNQLMKKRKSVPLQELKIEYFKLVADEKFKSIYPSILYDAERRGYIFHIEAQKAENIELQFGGNISSSTFTTFFLEMKYNQFDIQGLKLITNAYLGRFYNSATLGVRMSYPGEKPFYQDVVIGFNRFNYFNTNRMFFGDETPSYIKKNENFLNFNFAFPSLYTNKAKMNVGMNIATLSDNYYQTFNFTRFDTYDVNNFDMISVYFQREFNTLDKPLYPSYGMRLNFQTFFINGFERNMPGSTSLDKNATSNSRQWFALKFNYDNFSPVLPMIRMGLSVEAFLSNQSLSSSYVASKLRAPMFSPLPQSQVIFLRNYSDNNYITLGWKNICHLYKGINFRLESYIYQPIMPIIRQPDGTSQFAAWQDSYKHTAFIGSAILVYPTKVGPISLSLDYYSHYEDNFLFGLNFGYILFNNRPLY